VEILTVFVLYVFLDGRKVSDEALFYDVYECTRFAKALHNQGGKITAYCLPKQVRREGTRIY
jgi:hypothetical protein